jgi:DNA end-binding protein Ku
MATLARRSRRHATANTVNEANDRRSNRARADREDRGASEGGHRESRAISSATISFGLVTIPVELHSAIKSLAPAFHLVHETCGSRVHQQMYCPVHKRAVERSELVRGFDVGKDRYVVFTPEELEHLEGPASRTIDVAEFVPLTTVDPIYFETTYYLAPRKGGEKAYGLFMEAMAGGARLALATFVMRGKENLVAIRADDRGLILHTLFFADEVRSRPTLSQTSRHSRPEEVKLARRLIDDLASPTFTPARYRDAYRERVLEAARIKAKGKTLTVEPLAAPQAPVVNIMDALRASLEKRKQPARKEGGSHTRTARQAS